MNLVRIPAGSFMMGSNEGASDEKPVHPVRITKPFHMGVTEVTQEQYEAVMGDRPWSGKSYVGRSEDAPASYISWHDATGFCEKLSRKTGQTIMLPTEAQWEYACRAGSTTEYCFGDSQRELGEYAWYHDNTWDAGEKYPHRVAQKRPNDWGLYDMHGNVWEWCRDWYDSDYYENNAMTDPTGPSGEKYRVVRGGSWYSAPRGCRSAARGRDNPTDSDHYSGFRVVVSPRP
jgi:formylglycine-generating enzyme required for sulfatase activity